MSEHDQTTPDPDVDSPEYRQAAEQAARQVQEDPGTDAGQSVEQMADQMAQQKVRAAMSDFEQHLADILDRSRAAFDDQQAQIDHLTRQLQQVRQQAGPPDAVNLARSLATRVQSLAIAHPDLGQVHFAGVLSQAGQLADMVQAIADGKESATGDAERTAGNIARWFTRTHPRLSSRVIEGWHEAVSEAERIIDALPELVPVAAAVARAL